MWSAAPAWVTVLVSGSILGWLVGLLVLGLWVRRMFRSHVSDPIARLQSSVDNLSSADAALKSDVDRVEALAQKAHDRIDSLVVMKGTTNA